MSNGALRLASILALGAIASSGKKGQRNVLSVQDLRALIPELRQRWFEAWNDEEYDEDLDDFELSEYGPIPQAVKDWWEKKTGTTYLGHGNYRIVFDMHNGRVIKLALDYHGEGENRAQIESWNDLYDTDLGQLLAPLVDGDDDYVVMVKAKPIDQNNPQIVEMVNEASRQVEQLQDEHGISDTASLSNWGLLGGRVVLIDYAHEF